MTAQIEDIFRYGEAEYAVAGISEGRLFDPADLDLAPAMATTACWRGYQVIYSVVDSHLVVADLHIRLLEEGEGEHRKQGPTINGVVPDEKGDAFIFFNNNYTGLNFHLEYTGGLLLARGFLDELYEHMGFQAPWKYESVLELVFENGVLSGEFDRSDKLSKIRRLVIKSAEAQEANMPSTDEIRRFVDQAFDRSYKL